MDFMHILGQKEAIWNTIFSIFEQHRAPKRRGSGKTSPPPFPLSTGLGLGEQMLLNNFGFIEICKCYYYYSKREHTH